MIQRITLVCAILVLAASLAGCGGTEPPSSTSPEAVTTTMAADSEGVTSVTSTVMSNDRTDSVTDTTASTTTVTVVSTTATQTTTVADETTATTSAQTAQITTVTSSTTKPTGEPEVDFSEFE
ncbi:MAG: hypothetical protein E7553_02895 [Ruminococcaceae bacterium]|nr:hypothetical protein [Oscillospiraceae bacterium]